MIAVVMIDVFGVVWVGTGSFGGGFGGWVFGGFVLGWFVLVGWYGVFCLNVCLCRFVWVVCCLRLCF